MVILIIGDMLDGMDLEREEDSMERFRRWTYFGKTVQG
jgi:hypothetical protein